MRIALVAIILVAVVSIIVVVVAGPVAKAIAENAVGSVGPGRYSVVYCLVFSGLRAQPTSRSCLHGVLGPSAKSSAEGYSSELSTAPNAALIYSCNDMFIFNDR